MTLREQLHTAIGRTDASEGLPHWHTVSDTPDGQPRHSVYVERQAVLDIIDRLVPPATTPAGVLDEAALRVALTDHWTQLLATADYWHALQHAGPFEECPRRVCSRAREVAAVADGLLDLESKAAAVRVEMRDALARFGETLPDDSEPVQ